MHFHAVYIQFTNKSNKLYKNKTINKNILFNIDKQIWKCYINHKKIVSKIQYPK